MSEFQEKRKSKRIGINVKIKLQKVNNNLIAFGLKEEEFEVNVVNISKDGMAFRTNERLALNSFMILRLYCGQRSPSIQLLRL